MRIIQSQHPKEAASIKSGDAPGVTMDHLVGLSLGGPGPSRRFIKGKFTTGTPDYTRKMMVQKFITQEQTNYIQGRLKMLGENTVTLAARLRLPWSTVAGTINGNRANPQARQAIAAFLGEPVEKLFGGNGEECREISHG